MVKKDAGVKIPVLDKDETGKKVDITGYRGMIGSLLYLTASRPVLIPNDLTEL